MSAHPPTIGPCPECGHELADHVASGWGRHTVCVEKLDTFPEGGYYGVCPCVLTSGPSTSTLDAGQGRGAPAPSSTRSLTPSAAVAPVPGRAAAHSFTTSPPTSQDQGEARGLGHRATGRPARHSHLPLGARAAGTGGEQ